ncbi:guanine nucleotide exchange protein [Acrasis kona]|uniref:Guanine nucleotide exchange protein n=1 Tax=Acrasis kona TaxID=1008807 RepID=A0AAW2YM20_9EUKA
MYFPIVYNVSINIVFLCCLSNECGVPVSIGLHLRRLLTITIVQNKMDGVVNTSLLSITSDDQCTSDEIDTMVEAEDEDSASHSISNDDDEYDDDYDGEKYDTNNKSQINTVFIKSIIISVWDNTLGPSILHNWNGLGSHNKLDADVTTFISKFTVVDELPNLEEIGQNIEFKFNVSKDNGIIVATCIFKGKLNRSTTVFAFSLVLGREMLSKYLSLNRIIKDNMMNVASILQGLCNKNIDTTQVLIEFEPHLTSFVGLFDSLNKTGLPHFNIEGTMFKSMINPPTELLSKAITSHLETHGYSVVIGTDQTLVNQWVNTLSLFLSPSERVLCKHARKDSEFTPEIFVQGLLYQQPYAKDLWTRLVPISGVLSGRFPVTIVDLHSNTVRSFRKFNHFGGLKKEFFDCDLRTPYMNNNGMTIDLKLYRLDILYKNNQSLRPSENEKLYQDHFSVCNHVAPCVKRFFELICGYVPVETRKRNSGNVNTTPNRNNEHQHHYLNEILPMPIHLKLGLVNQFMQLLNRRALCLAKFVTVLTQKMNVDTVIDRNELKEEVLDLKGNMTVQEKDLELMVVLAHAEKLMPGVYRIVTGDPQQEADNLADFFDEI